MLSSNCLCTKQGLEINLTVARFRGNIHIWYNTIFIRTVTAANINFSLAWVRLLMEGGFNLIMTNTWKCKCQKIVAQKTGLQRLHFRVIEIRSSKKLPHCSRKRPKRVSARIPLVIVTTPTSKFTNACTYHSRTATIQGVARIDPLQWAWRNVWSHLGVQCMDILYRPNVQCACSSFAVNQNEWNTRNHCMLGGANWIHYLSSLPAWILKFRFHIQFSKHTAFGAPPTDHAN